MRLVDLTPEFVAMVAHAVAAVALDGQSVKVVIGRDTRGSGAVIRDIFKDVLSVGGVVVIDAGILPTAALAFLVSDLSCHMGIMITASHNTAEWNGIKLFNKDGKKVMHKEIEAIEREMDRILNNQVQA